MMLDENGNFAETAEDPACSSLHELLSSCPLHVSPTTATDLTVTMAVSATSVSSLATPPACTCAAPTEDNFSLEHTTGHHACGFYQTQKERDQLVIQFFREGFARHEKMLYVHHYSTPAGIMRLVHDWLGIDLTPHIVAGDVSFRSTASLYKRNGVVDPSTTIDQVRTMAQEAKQQGYARLRVTGEMCWVPACDHPIQELLAYESVLNGAFAEYDVWAMCQYNVNRWAPDQLINVLSVHPILMMGNEAFQNIYHMPPEEYFVEDLAANTLKHWVHNLEQRKKMESQLHERTLELLAINQTLQEEIQERQRMIDAKNAAEAVSKAKSEFMSVMSHEIRTPLNGIVVMTKLLGQTELSEEQRDYVESIDVSGEHLLTMLNDVLDFSKIESGALSLDNRPFETEACLKGVLSMFKWTTEMEDVPTIELHISPDVPPVLMADVTRVRQILFNFLSNSVKFTPSGGRVWVHVCCVPSPTNPDEQEVQFEVGDTGIGIPEAKWPLIFNTFSQVDASITRKYGGTGLGLAISKRLAERMDGRIWFESREGQGSTFYFTVPVRIPTLSALLEVEHVGPAEAARRAGMVSPAPASVSRRRADSDLLLSASPPRAAMDGGGASEADVGRLRILVAEDNATNQKVVRRILDKLGCTPDKVIVVDNGAKAVAAVAAAHFDIVFMDLQMPVMGGLDACRHILRLDWSGRAEARPAVVAMTAAASEEDKQQCMNAGMDGHVSKPIKIERVAHILQAVALASYPTTSSSTSTSSSPSSSSSFAVLSTLSSLAPSSPGTTPEAAPSLPTTPAREAAEQAPVGQSASAEPSPASSSSSSWSSLLGSTRCVDLPLLPHTHNQNQPHHPNCHQHHHHLHQHHASLGIHRAPTPADHCW